MLNLNEYYKKKIINSSVSLPAAALLLCSIFYISCSEPKILVPDFKVSNEYGVDWYLWVTDNNSITYDFNLYIPENYDEINEYPALVSLHGGGAGFNTAGPHPLNELGGDSLIQLFDSDGTFLPDGRKNLHPDIRNSFVIIPEEQHHNWMASNGYWNAEAVNQILDYVAEEYRIDKDRIYMTGGSYGGWGTYYVCAENNRQDLVPAAIVPLCGGCDFTEVLTGASISLENFKHMGIWQFHSIDDYVVSYRSGVTTLQKIIPGKIDLLDGYPSSPDKDMTVTYDEVNGLGEWQEGVVFPEGIVTMTLFSSGGHGMSRLPDYFFDIWDWLYDQSR